MKKRIIGLPIFDLKELKAYINFNQDKDICELYKSLKKKKFRYMCNAEKVVYAYLKAHKKELGIR